VTASGPRTASAAAELSFGPDDPTFEVVAVRYATRETRKSECFYRYASYGEPDEPLVMDYFFWLLRDGGRAVVVDTGFDPSVGERRGRTCLVPPLEALARLGVDPESVPLVVLTHLHDDHTGNVDLEDMYAGYELLRPLAALPGASLLAGHDPLVLERFPVLDGGLGVRAG